MIGRPSAAAVRQRDVEIIQLAIDGVPPAAIEQRMMTVSRNTIYMTLSAARKAGHAIPRFKRGIPTGSHRGFALPDDAPDEIRAAVSRARTKAEAAVALARHGFESGDIARLIQSTRRSVHVYLSNARREGEDIARESGIGPASERLWLDFTPEQARVLYAAALERGCSPRVLAMRLVNIAIRDELLDAILDDKRSRR